MNVSVTTRNNVVLVAGGLIVGVGSGYIFAKHRLEKQYIALADAEIESVKDTYRRFNKAEEYSTPEKAALTLSKLEVAPSTDIEDVIDRLEYRVADTNYRRALVEGPDGRAVLETVGEEDETVTVNVFEERLESIDQRDPNNPYIIGVEEFMDTEVGFSSITITYYEGDDTLADERDQIITDVENIVGVSNLDGFGVGSKEDHIVYVRNERISTDFEIVREERGYAEAVLGLHQDMLEESGKKPRNRSRDNG